MRVALFSHTHSHIYRLLGAGCLPVVTLLFAFLVNQSRWGVSSGLADSMPALQGTREHGSGKGHGEDDDDGSRNHNTSNSNSNADPFVQNLFVMRHGEEEAVSDDNERPWDPPLSERGKLQAWRVGRDLRLDDWNITRIVMSPFLRCVQTAAEVIAGLCLLPSSVDQSSTAHSRRNAGPVATTLKASIECGLAHMLKRQGIPYPSQVAHKNNSLLPWTLDLPQLYSLLPRGIFDTSYQPFRQTLPSCRETAADIQCRFTTTLQKIANKYHSEHILCITHGDGVMKSVSMMWPRVEVYGVTYCAYIHAQRPNFERDDGINIVSGEWELLTESGSSSRIFFGPSQ